MHSFKLRCQTPIGFHMELVNISFSQPLESRILPTVVRFVYTECIFFLCSIFVEAAKKRYSKKMRNSSTGARCHSPLSFSTKLQHTFFYTRVFVVRRTRAKFNRQNNLLLTIFTHALYIGRSRSGIASKFANELPIFFFSIK